MKSRFLEVLRQNPYMVMEYMKGGSLYGAVKSGKFFNWKERAKIAVEIAEGLALLHRQDIVHRDLKGMNVLLDEKGHAKLGDFGLARIKTESASGEGMTNQSVGTLAWMAPELFERGATYTKSSDIYSLGVLLWELASGKLPFADAANSALIPVWVQRGDREAIPMDTPAWYKEVIERCWQGGAAHRPGIEEVVSLLADGLNTIKREQGKEARPFTPAVLPAAPVSQLYAYTSSAPVTQGGYLGSSSLYTTAAAVPVVNQSQPSSGLYFSGSDNLRSQHSFFAPAPAVNQSPPEEKNTPGTSFGRPPGQ